MFDLHMQLEIFDEYHMEFFKLQILHLPKLYLLQV